MIEQVDELTPRAEEAGRLKDLVDEYKHAAERGKKSEAVIGKYKVKLEEMGELRRSIKVRFLFLFYSFTPSSFVARLVPTFLDRRVD